MTYQTYGEYKEAEQQAWGEEQERLASESAEAMADAEAKGEMPETIISNEDIREIVRERIGNILEDYSDVFRDAHIVGLAIDAVLEIPNLAVVDRDAKPPIRFIHPDDSGVLSYEKCKRDMLKTGWVKEIK